MRGKTDVREIAGLLARLAVGALFIYAGAAKALSPAEEFAFAIEGYKVLPPQLSLLAAYMTPWIELWAGLLLAAGVYTRFSALFCGSMLAFFEVLLAQAMIRRLPVTSCGCFGSSGTSSIEHEFVQNLVFIALAWLAWKYGSRWSADRFVETL